MIVAGAVLKPLWVGRITDGVEVKITKDNMSRLSLSGYLVIRRNNGNGIE